MAVPGMLALQPVMDSRARAETRVRVRRYGVTICLSLTNPRQSTNTDPTLKIGKRRGYGKRIYPNGRYDQATAVRPIVDDRRADDAPLRAR